MIVEIRNKVNKTKQNDANQVNDMLSRLRSAFSIIKDQIHNFKTVKDQLKIIKDLKDKLQTSKQLSSQMTKIFTMISFYQQINGNIQINSMFLKNISQQISQNINKLTVLRQKHTSQQQRKQMERRFNAQMEERRRQMYEMQERQQRRYQKMIQSSKLDVQKQRRRYQEQLKSMNKDQPQKMKQMEAEIRRITPPEIKKQEQKSYWQKCKEKCQIF